LFVLALGSGADEVGGHGIVLLKNLT
jgi:hypothetical protein